jgi:hypothetical protein
MRRGFDAAQRIREIRVEQLEGPPRERHRRAVALEVEAVELDRQPRIGRVGQYGVVGRKRPPRGVDQRQLHLRADRRRTLTEAGLREQQVERLELLPEPLAEAPGVVVVELFLIEPGPFLDGGQAS